MGRSRIEREPVQPALLAFYLPQFHPIPENDEWWGHGFTEWRNVIRGRPLYPDHYQPHVPGELGFYDLRMPEIREAQAALAEAHGITGFCYYHYWFSGRRILERPFGEVLATGSPDFPFSLCWANESWTRNWDGGTRETLIGQRHSIEDDRNHIHWLMKAFRDERYVRIADRPVFFVYNAAALPDAPRTVEVWREECAKAGVGDPFLIRFDTFTNAGDPLSQGWDAAAEFLPHGVYDTMQANGYSQVVDIQGMNNLIYRYDDLVASQLARALPAWTRYQCVVPGWDNTPRKPHGSANLFLGSTPESYEAWLRATVQKASSARHELVLINAWNEWAEGTHLEPDVRFGRAYLEATARAVGADPSQFDLFGVHRGRKPRPRNDGGSEPRAASAVDVHELYEELRASSAREIEALLREMQELEDRLSQGQGDAGGSSAQIATVRRLEQRLWQLRARLARVPFAGRAVRTLKVLRRDWRSL